jgi:hypothetical protein
MEQSLSWTPNVSLASQDVARILWNAKVHSAAHKNSSPVCIPGQFSPRPRILFFQDPFYYYSPIYAYSFQMVSSFSVPHQTPACTAPFPLIIFSLLISDYFYKTSLLVVSINNTECYLCEVKTEFSYIVNVTLHRTISQWTHFLASQVSYRWMRRILSLTVDTLS